MKTKYNYLLVFLGCLLFFPLTTNAECSYERQAELSKIASNVQFNYTYDMSSITEKPQFTVLFTNLKSDVYIIDSLGDTISGNGETQKVYFDDQSISFIIYSNDNACKGEKILTQYLALPIYNKFYQTDVCKENQKNELCAVWRDNNMYSYDEFADMIKQENQLTKQNQIENNGNGIIQFLEENQTTLIIVLAALLLLIVGLLISKRLRR